MRGLAYCIAAPELAETAQATYLRCQVLDVNEGEGKRVWGLPAIMEGVDMDREARVRMNTEMGEVAHPFFDLTRYKHRMVPDHGSRESPFAAICYTDEGVTGADRIRFRNFAHIMVDMIWNSDWYPFHIIEGGRLVSGVCAGAAD